MKKLNYGFFYMLIFLISTLLLTILFYVYTQNTYSVDVNRISASKITQKFEERNIFFKNYFKQYEDTLHALSQNKHLQSYVNNLTHKQEVEELFVTVKKSLKDVIQLRLITFHGFEKIRVQGDSTNNNREVVTDNLLQDKSHRYYIRRFNQLKKDEIGYSKIDLERDFGQVVEPKVINVRLGKNIYDSNNRRQYILVMNIDLNRFVEEFKKTVLYNVYLVDNRGRFIIHPNKDRGIKSKSFRAYLLDDEFGQGSMQKILTTDELFNTHYYSKKVTDMNTGQELRIMLKLKFEELGKKKDDQNLFLFIIILFLIIAAIPVILYFSKVPNRLKEKIDRQHLTDALTQLPNREAFIQDIEHIEDLNRHHIILINVDNYKRISNAYGYKISEELIQAFSQYLIQLVENECHSRLYITTKSTFAFICNQDKYTYMMLKKVYKDIENHRFEVEENIDFLVDISIGVSSFEPIAMIEKYQEARVALDVARSNKEDIRIYDDNLKRVVEKRISNIELSSKVKSAIDNNQIKLFYQPIFNNYTNQVEKFETLVRLEYEGQLLFPDEFLEIAKDNKRYKHLTQQLIEKSFKMFALNTYEFSINLTIQDITNQDLMNYLFKQIEYYNIGRRLVIEIVESEAIDNFDILVEFIKKIKTHDVKIAIDDFGSGYSNYEYIVKLSEYIDYLKLDGSLVQGIHHNQKMQFLVGTLKFLCEKLKIEMIAEYIENEETFEFVKSMGIEYCQGYYIGMPTEKLVMNNNI